MPFVSAPDYRSKGPPGENAGVRRPVVFLAATAVVLLAMPASAAAPVPVLVIDGRGHGHGVGMAQDGALAMGKNGASTAQILTQFYPGTALGRGGGEVRVAVLTAPGNVAVVRFPNGGEVRDARDGGQSAGFPVRIGPGGSARLRFDGKQFAVEVSGGAAPAPATPNPPPAETTTTSAAPTTTTTAPRGLLQPGQPLLPLPAGPLLPSIPLLTTTTTAPPTTTLPPAPAEPARFVSGRGLWAVPAGGGTVEVLERGARYRGVIQAGGGSPLRLINHVDVEQYLRGMGEVRNPSWPAASLRAQAIAARTYALRAVAGGGELCDTQQCQVYLGAQAEYAAMDRAVTATRGQVVLYRRSLASTVYSANGGGFSASTEEGFGTSGTGYPYLRPSEYPTGDPLQWTVTVSLRDVASRVGFRGKVGNVTVRKGPSGRVTAVTVEGSGRARTVSGIEFDKALGLKSTLFAVRMAQSASAPPPPPSDAGAVQGLPGGGEVEAEAVDGEVSVGTESAGTLLPGPAVAAAAPAPSAGPSPAARAALSALAALLLVLVAGSTTAVRYGGSAGAHSDRRRPRTPDPGPEVEPEPA